MPKYKYTITINYQSRSGEIEADNYNEAKEQIARMYEGIEPDDVSVTEKGEALKSAAANAAVGAGCIGIGLLQLVFSAVPIAIAILIVLWVLKSCS